MPSSFTSSSSLTHFNPAPFSLSLVVQMRIWFSLVTVPQSQVPIYLNFFLGINNVCVKSCTDALHVNEHR
jgi:hypothetical protein